MKYLVALLFLVASAILHAADDHTLWYDKPATKWNSEALPLGNGRLGAMEFGGTTDARIMLNEVSMWTGGDNPTGAWTPVAKQPNDFGSYQPLGDLRITVGPAPPSISGEARGATAKPGGAQSITSSTDGDVNTKWCFEHEGKPIVWTCSIPAGQVIDSYSLTSAEDVPARDPRTWKLEGSTDGKTWKLLDEPSLAAPFEARKLKKEFRFANKTSYTAYRFTFPPSPEDKHFQLSEIALGGVGNPAGKPAANYRRSLDLAEAIATTTYTHAGVNFTRTVFVSKPDELVVVRITADKPGAVSGKLAYQDAHGSASASSSADIVSGGTLPNGLAWVTAIRALPDGGTSKAEADGTLSFAGCNSLTILVAARTNYVPDIAKKWISGDPRQTALADIAAGAQAGATRLRERQRADHKNLFDRFAIDLGSSAEGAALPTDQRLARYQKGAADPGLEALMVKLGRYLLISSSRDSLPANLQGIWNESTEPPWASDYHSNINVEMNYWPAEITNLSECHLAFLRFMEAQAPAAKIAVANDKKQFPKPVRGWTVRTSQNPRGGNAWNWNIPANAWYMLHVWEHYAFTGDKEFLRDTGYPMIKDITCFWLDNLKELSDGSLVVPNGWSPEHGPHADGVAHDQQLLRELFDAFVAAADILGTDKLMRDEVAAKRARLAADKIGSWGQLMEWRHEIPELEKSGHRHTSHLFALYPGKTISVNKSPELAKAAEVSLVQRSTAPGDSAQSWAWPWRAAMWARLGRPERIPPMVRGLLSRNTLPNLFCTASGVFQIDGNFGITAAICEALVQSHAAEIHILPALPPTWPDGAVKGIKARGGHTLDIVWKNGAVTSATVTKGTGSLPPIRIQGKPVGGNDPRVTVR